MNGEIEHLKSTITRLEGEKDFLNRKIKVRDNRIKVLSDAIADVSVVSNLIEKSNKIRQLEGELAELKFQYKNLRDYATRQEKLVDKKNLEYFDLKKEINSLKSELAEAKKESEKLKFELNKCRYCDGIGTVTFHEHDDECNENGDCIDTRPTPPRVCEVCKGKKRLDL